MLSRLIPIIFAALSTSVAGAQSITSERIYVRCHTQIMKSRPMPGDGLRVQVRDGRISASEACIRLVQLATFNSQGRISNVVSPPQVAVLQNFFDFHRSWFPGEYVKQIPFDRYPANMDVIDPMEPALHVTRALFAPGARYSEIVTGGALEAIRSNGPQALGPYAGTTPGRYVMGDPPDLVSFVAWPNVTFAQSGFLHGIAPIRVLPLAQGSLIGRSIFTDRLPIYPGQPTNIPNILTNFNAGVIGTQAYLMLNYGRGFGEPSDGGRQMGRRWSKAVLGDLLCRDVPALRQTDSPPFVQPGSALSFRKGQSCMQCHATYDRLAGALRNHFWMTSASRLPPDGCEAIQCVKTVFFSPFTPTMPAEAGPTDRDPDFHLRPPNGTLFYRSYDGTLIDVPVSGLTNVGFELAKTNDLYVCAAKRYFEYFTGIGVNLQDSGDPINPPLSAADQKYRDIVIRLGLNLKAHQSLTELMREIFDTDVYKSSDFRGTP
ncbi:MAG: hypothetical protein ABL958_05090 [Bdellovibrionia bacterium]